MKKILKNSTFISMGVGVLFALVSLITFIFVKNTTYFSIMYILNIVANFAVIILNINKGEESLKFKSLTQACYILLTLAILYLDILIISNVWDMNVYYNVMHVTNTMMYLIIYSLMMAFILLLNLYNVIKYNKNIQNSTKSIENERK